MCQLCRAVDRRTFLRGSALGGAATLLAPGAALAGDGRHEARRGRFDIGLRWFGTNGWELTFGSHRLLVDPYLTRLDVGIAKGKFDPTTELRSDRAAIDKHLKEADLILVTHGHYDHLADVPAVVERTGGRVLGSETHVNLLAALGVPADHLIPVSGGEALDFGGYTITAIPSLHSRDEKHRFVFPGHRPSAPKDRPATVADLVEGDTLAWLVNTPDTEVLLFGTGNFIEREIRGLRPDVAVLATYWGTTHRYLERLIDAIAEPAVIVATHWDDFESPLEEPARDTGHARRLPQGGPPAQPPVAPARPGAPGHARAVIVRSIQAMASLTAAQM